MLTAEQTSQLEALLKKLELEVLKRGMTDGALKMAQQSEVGGDSIDQSNTEELLSSAFRMQDRDLQSLTQIREAKKRAEEGSINECDDCGDDIGFRRLMARPMTRFCISCQEEAEDGDRVQRVLNAAADNEPNEDDLAELASSEES